MDRRQVVKGAAAMMAAASMNIRPVEGGNRRAYDFDDPAQALDALVKMRGDFSRNHE